MRVPGDELAHDLLLRVGQIGDPQPVPGFVSPQGAVHRSIQPFFGARRTKPVGLNFFPEKYNESTIRNRAEIQYNRLTLFAKFEKRGNNAKQGENNENTTKKQGELQPSGEPSNRDRPLAATKNRRWAAAGGTRTNARLEFSTSPIWLEKQAKEEKSQ